MWNTKKNLKVSKLEGKERKKVKKMMTTTTVSQYTVSQCTVSQCSQLVLTQKWNWESLKRIERRMKRKKKEFKLNRKRVELTSS